MLYQEIRRGDLKPDIDGAVILGVLCVVFVVAFISLIVHIEGNIDRSRVDVLGVSVSCGSDRQRGYLVVVRDGRMLII